MNTAPLLNIEALMVNAGGDQSLAKELVGMGLTRLDETVPALTTLSQAGEWMDFAQHIHKLRPMLSFSGIKVLNEELLEMEKNIKSEPSQTPTETEVQNILKVLQSARTELQDYLDKNNN